MVLYELAYRTRDPRRSGTCTSFLSFENKMFTAHHTLQELMTKRDCETTTESIRKEFKTFKETVNEERDRKGHKHLKVNVEHQLWNPTIKRLADLEEIAERAVPKLSRFVKSYHDYVDDSIRNDDLQFTPIKVAIIDNGILSVSPRADTTWDLMPRRRLDDQQGEGASTFENERSEQLRHQAENFGQAVENIPNSNASKTTNTLWARIRGGRSFVDDNSRLSPWFFASDPHGTQMANLICAIDPHCHLYVAKVTEGSSGITPARVTRVGAHRLFSPLSL
jgi:hypothetical protein